MAESDPKNKKKSIGRMKRARTLQDLKQAEMDPQLQYRVRQQSSVPGIITGTDLIMIRKFARLNLQLARQKDSKMTLQKLERNLTAVLKKVKPEMREIMLKQMREEVSASE